MRSHPAWDAWIEIFIVRQCPSSARRIPHGMRGLKSCVVHVHHNNPRRIPHGMRGLKSSMAVLCLVLQRRRIPHGMRGLKFPIRQTIKVCRRVASRMGCVD